MQLTSIALTLLGAAKPVTVSGNPTIEGPPDEHAAREVHEGRSPPQSAQAPRKIANRFGAPMAIAAGVDDAHLGHQPIVRHVGPALSNLGVVQREIAELLLTVPPRQFANLRGANAAIAVENHHVGFRALVGRRQFVLGHRVRIRRCWDNESTE